MLNFTGSYSDPQNSLSLRFRRDCQVSKYSLWLSILTVSKAKPGQTTTYKTNNKIMISLSIAVVLLDITWSFKWWFDYFGRKFSDCSLIRHTVDQTLGTTKQTKTPEGIRPTNKELSELRNGVIFRKCIRYFSWSFSGLDTLNSNQRGKAIKVNTVL